MSNKIKIGLLKFYLKLYDDKCPECRAKMEEFAATIQREYEKRNIDVVFADICRVDSEFQKAVKTFEETKVDAIVTLHLAYSPSLESIRALAKTALPLIILDTTPDFRFDVQALNDGKLMYNHGIHGVQDICNLLLRENKDFEIVAGHYAQDHVIDRSIELLKGLKGANSFCSMQVGLIGEPFEGMGDFAISFDKLKKLFDISVKKINPGKIAKCLPEKNSSIVTNEIEQLKHNYKSGKYSQQCFEESVQASLALRSYIKENQLGAFSFNFLAFDGKKPALVVPFLEASLAMSRQIGYAGEGDVLTAALCGALLQMFPDSSFTEMFCPDWESNLVFLSHMGEINPNLCSSTARLEEKDFPYTPANNPMILNGSFKKGDALLINIAPKSNDEFNLIVAEVEIIERAALPNGTLGGWLKPKKKSLPEFLTSYSQAGGTHHNVLSYAGNINSLKTFAKKLKIDYITI